MEALLRIPKKHKTSTPDKLLDAASKIFAKKGFQAATIEEICRKADANHAAINYHFRSKENLYREAWRHVFNKSIEANPPDGGAPETAPPEERMRAQLTSLIRRVTDKNNQAYNFLFREYANPTGLLDVIREEIKPIQQRTRKVIRELIGPSPDEQTVLFCEMAIIGACTNPMLVHGRRGQEQGEKESPALLIDDVEAYARHVVQFTLADLAAIRQKAKA